MQTRFPFSPLLPALLLLLLAGSCAKQSAPMAIESTYLIFGHAYGHCAGEACVETFLLRDGQLFEDTLDHYSKETPYEGHWVELSNDLYRQAENLPDQLPDSLLQLPSQTFGTPDAYDQGGYYIELADGSGGIRAWQLDTDLNNLPEYLHPLAGRLSELLRDISDF